MNLVGLDRRSLEQFFVEHGEKSFRAQQVMQWLYQRGVTDMSQMTDLSKSLRLTLQQLTCIKFPTIASEQFSKDGTIKWLLNVGEDRDGNANAIETVFIPETNRGTLCISS